uniref:Coronin n=1 Tax=Trichuris muris TaxID=70415 RepID=A0A5S6QRW6_TRIMR
MLLWPVGSAWNISAMQFVRQSKFRHVFCKSVRREGCVEDVRITKIAWDSLFCAVNPKFLAVIVEGSGGPFMVIPIGKTGRIEKDHPVVDAHKAPCLEVAWCPFNDNVIASCSEDCTAKIWHIPDGGLQKSLKTPLMELLAHQKRVTAVLWHPTANNVLLTVGADAKIFLWNVSTGEALIEIAGHPDLIWSIDFNYNGSKLLTTCKDKMIRVIDPRSGRILQQGAGHEGVKPQRAIFLKDGRIFSTGFTRRSERMYALRSEQALEEPVIQEELDTSNGVLYPLYDADTGLVYLCGRGDSNIRYYEVNSDPPFVHYINTYTSPEPQRGIGFMPKRGLNVDENEIARIYKCTNKGLVEILQFFVPRKSEMFQEDLYPDTVGTVPAISAEEWFNGQDADPILVPLRSDKRQSEHSGEPKKAAVRRANILAEMPSAEPSSATTVSRRRSMAASQETAPKAEPSLNAAADVLIQQRRESVPAKSELFADADMGIVQLRHHEPRDDAYSSGRQGAGGATETGFFSAALASHRPRSEFMPKRAPEHNHMTDPNERIEELTVEVNRLKRIVRQLASRLRTVEQQMNGHDLSDLENA